MRLDKITNISVILASLVVTVYGSSALYRSSRPAELPDQYHVGEKIGEKGAFEFASSPLTVLLVTRSTCKFCQASLPFYQRLTHSEEVVKGRVIAVSIGEDPETHRAFLASAGIRVDGSVSAMRSGIRSRATPTILLVGRDGLVKGAWVGKLDDAHQANVLAAIKAGSSHG